MIGVECIARGYLAGLGLESYRDVRRHLRRPAAAPAWSRARELPEPVFTPTTKAELGQHDEFIGFDEVARGGGRRHGRRSCAS